ncbi:MAG: hypothetical protein QM680_04575 [Luteolibacter sp.]
MNKFKSRRRRQSSRYFNAPSDEFEDQAALMDRPPQQRKEKETSRLFQLLDSLSSSEGGKP